MGKTLPIILLFIVCNLYGASRVVSLAPNITEIIYALGKGDSLVGTTTYCDYPSQALKKTKVGTYERPSVEQIILLKPTLVVLTKGNPSTLPGRLKALNIQTFYLETDSIHDLPSQITKLSTILKAEKRGKALSKKITDSFAKLKSFGKKVKKGTYLYLFSVTPMISLRDNTIIGELFNLAGYKNILPKGGTPYPQVSSEWLHLNKPDVVVLDESNTKKTMMTYLKNKYAFKNFLILPKDLFMRPGPRLIEAAEFLQNPKEIKN